MRSLLASVNEVTIRLFIVGSLVVSPLISFSVKAAVPDGNPPINETVDFEDIAVPVDDRIDAFDFRSGNLFFDTDNDDSNFLNGDVSPFASNTTTYLFLSGYFDSVWVYPTALITVGRGVPFELDELDLSETYTGEDAISVRVVGNFVAGGSVTTDVTLDTVMDGPGGAADFETVAFDGTWVDLESVSVQTLTGNNSGSVAIDDIDVSYIPDNCPDDYNPGQEDADFDEVGDACDNCINTPNFDQSNSDTDVWGDACDNCPDDDNVGQEDVDIDGIGDVCDLTPDSETEVIDFEDRVEVKLNTVIDAADFVSGNLFVDTDESNTSFGAGLLHGEFGPRASNGSIYFYSYGGDDGGGILYPEVILSLDGEGLFDLHSLEIAECCVSDMAWTVQVTGTFDDDSTIGRVITLDQVIDGLGGAEDFQKVKFNYQWVGLASVSVKTLSGVDEAEWGIDNVEIGYVPEPSTTLLQVIALSCLVALRSRKRS